LETTNSANQKWNDALKLRNFSQKFGSHVGEYQDLKLFGYETVAICRWVTKFWTKLTKYTELPQRCRQPWLRSHV